MIKFYRTIFTIFTLLFSACQPKNEPAHAQRTAQETVRAHLDYIDAVNEGLSAAREGKAQQALNAYIRSTEAKPEIPVGWNNVCFQLIQMQRYAEALKNCDKALKLEPSFELAKNNRLTALRLLNETKKSASVRAKELMAQAKPDPNQVIDTGMMLYQINEYEEAINLWKLVSPDLDQYPLAQNNIATAFILLKDYEAAERALNAALQREPDNSLYLNNKKWLDQEKSKTK